MPSSNRGGLVMRSSTGGLELFGGVDTAGSIKSDWVTYE